MEDLIGGVIAFVLMNFTVTFFVIGMVMATASVLVRRPGREDVFATYLNWFLFFAIGVTYLFNGIMHTVFGDLSASMIGWENNGFQAEVGFASIGMALVGILAFPRRMPFSVKLAALVGPTCFLWGAAGTHIVDIVANGNLSHDNAGPVLYTDLLIPVIGLTLWGLTVGARRRVPTARAQTVAPTAVGNA